MPEKGKERRDHERFDVPCTVCLLSRSGQAIATVETINISDGGALMSAREEVNVSVGDRITIEVTVPEKGDPDRSHTLSCPATVIRKVDAAAPYDTLVAVAFPEPLDPSIKSLLTGSDG